MILTDAVERPVAFLLTPGNIADITAAPRLLANVQPPRRLVADRAYDAVSLRRWLDSHGGEAVIPPNPTRKHPHTYDAEAYKSRNLIERMFCRLKDFRRIATRYDKRFDIFLSAIPLAAAITGWINGVRTLRPGRGQKGCTNFRSMGSIKGAKGAKGASAAGANTGFIRPNFYLGGASGFGV